MAPTRAPVRSASSRGPTSRWIWSTARWASARLDRGGPRRPARVEAWADGRGAQEVLDASLRADAPERRRPVPDDVVGVEPGELSGCGESGEARAREDPDARESRVGGRPV